MDKVIKDAETGRFVSEEYAEQNQSTTYTQKPLCEVARVLNDWYGKEVECELPGMEAYSKYEGTVIGASMCEGDEVLVYVASGDKCHWLSESMLKLKEQ